MKDHLNIGIILGLILLFVIIFSMSWKMWQFFIQTIPPIKVEIVYPKRVVNGLMNKPCIVTCSNCELNYETYNEVCK